jgi:hypothetical protein
LSAFEAALQAKGRNYFSYSCFDGSYIAGRTGSSDFWIRFPIQDTYGGGLWDGFVAKLDPTGSHLLFSTFLGGSGTDRGFAMAMDASGTVYSTGDTNSPDFPVSGNPAQGAFAGGQSDAFVITITNLGNLTTPASLARRAK